VGQGTDCGSRRLNWAERGRLAGMGTVVLTLNFAGWALFFLAVEPRHFRYPGLGLGFGVAFTSWSLGARHAFDADHLSAIDNTTRKLMADGTKPLATGFFFSLGHATTIVVAGVGLAAAARAVFGAIVDPHSTYETVGGVIGTSLSASFLYLIAVLNLVVLAGIVGVFRRMRKGTFSETELEHHLQSRGLMFRFFGRLMGSITRSWHLFFVGLVFAIGFDTATEVLLLTATATASTGGLPWYAVLALPVLFASGLILFDTLDGVFMNVAYGWAFARPVRKVYYNLVITGLSIFVAFFIGTVEVLSLMSAELHLHGGLWDLLGSFDLNKAGFTIAGVFLLVWLTAIAYWRMARVETRWATTAEPSGGGVDRWLLDGRVDLVGTVGDDRRALAEHVQGVNEAV
jgi:nickel/cobalt transporter (NiCoT) family protein